MDDKILKYHFEEVFRSLQDAETFDILINRQKINAPIIKRKQWQNKRIDKDDFSTITVSEATNSVINEFFDKCHYCNKFFTKNSLGEHQIECKTRMKMKKCN